MAIPPTQPRNIDGVHALEAPRYDCRGHCHTYNTPWAKTNRFSSLFRRFQVGIGKIANSALLPLGIKVSRISAEPADQNKYQPRYDLAPDQVDGLNREVRKVLNLAHYTKTSDAQYSAESYESGYHSIELDDCTFSGQRTPKIRLDAVPFQFDGATVLDIGCNQGGMLIALSDKIRHGVGIDYDSRVVNTANRIKSYKQLGNIDFYVFNLETESLSVIDNFLKSQVVDIVFLLSVCMWIQNWRQVIDKARALSANLLFESNGTHEQQRDQEHYLRNVYRNVSLIRDSSPDDSLQQFRKLFLCSDGSK
jgi:SAM-dependent methyltransferase